jgi:hypothetical protein
MWDGTNFELELPRTCLGIIGQQSLEMSAPVKQLLDLVLAQLPNQLKGWPGDTQIHILGGPL